LAPVDCPVIVIGWFVVITVEPESSIASSATGPAVNVIRPFVELTVREVSSNFPLPLNEISVPAVRFPVGSIPVPPMIEMSPAVAVREAAPA
jgi:hypothetical protein